MFQRDIFYGFWVLMLLRCLYSLTCKEQAPGKHARWRGLRGCMGKLEVYQTQLGLKYAEFVLTQKFSAVSEAESLSYDCYDWSCICTAACKHGDRKFMNSECTNMFMYAPFLQVGLW